MSEAAFSRVTLVERLIKLVGTGALDAEAAAHKLRDIDDEALAQMVNTLEAASAKATAARRPAANIENRRVELENQRESALAKLQAVADRIRERRDARNAGARHAEAAIVKLIENRDVTRSLAPSIELLSAINAAQHHTLQHIHLIDFKAVGIAQDIMEALDLQPATMNLLQRTNRLRHAAVEAYLHHMAVKSSLDVLRLIGKDVAGTIENQRFNRLLQVQTMRTAAFDPIFIPDRKPTLSPALAAESLAKLALFAQDFRATRIMAIGAGGDIVGRFLAAELRSRAKEPAYVHVARLRGRRSWGRYARDAGSEDRILIVADMIAVAEPIEEIRDSFETRQHRSTAVVALGARADLHEQLTTSGTSFFTHLIVNNELTLPWTRSGGYVLTRSSHVFGHEGPRPFRIARDFMASIATSLRSMMGGTAR